VPASALSIVIPCLNEAAIVRQRLSALQGLRERGHQLILVDGGSDDGTPDLAAGLVDQLLASPAGRARQMNCGAEAAEGVALWFLHLDTEVPADADRLILKALEHRLWGRFDVRLSGRQTAFRVIEWMMNRRSCLTGIATGDQGVFVRRNRFEQVRGYPRIELMEDIALSRRLKRQGLPACIKTPLRTSSRRWETHGIVRTVVLMWSLRLAYFLGASPAFLARRYPSCPTDSPKHGC